MKYNAKDIEIDEWEFNSNYVQTSPSINENIKLTDFIYLNPEPGLFKLVLHWDVSIKDREGGSGLAHIIGEQEFLIKLEGVEDKEELKNIISTSQLHLQEEFTNRVKSTWMESYLFLWFDVDPFAEEILLKVKNASK